jgi:hypothetical protein
MPTTLRELKPRSDVKNKTSTSNVRYQRSSGYNSMSRCYFVLGSPTNPSLCLPSQLNSIKKPWAHETWRRTSPFVHHVFSETTSVALATRSSIVMRLYTLHE